MYVIFRNQRLSYVEDFHGEEVLWITEPSKIHMEYMKFVGGYPNEYCIYIKDLSAEEQADIRKQINKKDI